MPTAAARRRGTPGGCRRCRPRVLLPEVEQGADCSRPDHRAGLEQQDVIPRPWGGQQRAQGGVVAAGEAQVPVRGQQFRPVAPALAADRRADLRRGAVARGVLDHHRAPVLLRPDLLRQRPQAVDDQVRRSVVHDDDSHRRHRLPRASCPGTLAVTAPFSYAPLYVAAVRVCKFIQFLPPIFPARFRLPGGPQTGQWRAGTDPGTSKEMLTPTRSESEGNASPRSRFGFVSGQMSGCPA